MVSRDVERSIQQSPIIAGHDADTTALNFAKNIGALHSIRNPPEVQVQVQVPAGGWSDSRIFFFFFLSFGLRKLTPS
jgi:hypothetical protein